jgi:hypothetical protein
VGVLKIEDEELTLGTNIVPGNQHNEVTTPEIIYILAPVSN